VGPALNISSICPARKGRDSKNTGFSFVDSLGNHMVEFHMDDFKQMDDADGLLGGNFSIHFPSHVNPLIIIGYDECIFM
jgi:hypothetical protein